MARPQILARKIPFFGFSKEPVAVCAATNLVVVRAVLLWWRLMLPWAMAQLSLMISAWMAVLVVVWLHLAVMVQPCGS